MIATVDLLWTLKGASSREIFGRMEERSDEECVAAFDQHWIAGFRHEQFRLIANQVSRFGRTVKVMEVVELTERERIRNAFEALGIELLEASFCASLELYALVVECFVRMKARGLSFPEDSPHRLIAETD